MEASRAQERRVDGRATRWAGHRDQRRADFVDAALRAIDLHGPAATVDQIGAEAGATRQAVFRQFSDRRDLDHAIAARVAEQVTDELLPRLADLDLEQLGNVEDTIRLVLSAYLTYVQSHLAVYRFVRAHETEVAADSAVRQVKDTLGGRVAELARQVLAGLDLPAELADTFAIGMVGLADTVIGRWLDDDRGLTGAELVEQLARLLAGTVRGVTAYGPAAEVVRS